MGNLAEVPPDVQLYLETLLRRSQSPAFLMVDREGRIRASFYNAPEGDIASVTRSVMNESTGTGAPATAGRAP